MRTVSISREQATHDWYVVDLADVTVGRAAAHIASILRGKTKPSYTPNADTGDFVIAINAEKVRFTGAKMRQKIYRHHSGYPGGLREATAAEVLRSHPERVIMAAVQGMLPKNPLGRSMLSKFKVYAGPEHPHAAQCPKPLTLSV